MAGFEGCKQGASELLLLDLDGTIADITSEPGDARVDADAVRALGGLLDCDPFGLVIVTGRSLADADRMLAPVQLPILASHGAESRVRVSSLPLNLPRIDAVRGSIESVAARFPGVLVEWKPFSVAMHVRAVPHFFAPLQAALGAFERDYPAFRIQAGRLVLEVVPAGVSKAHAVGWLLQTAEYRARRAVYVGDDSADEAAMAVVELGGGRALRVAGEHFARSQSQFDGAYAVRAWLAEIAELWRGNASAGRASGIDGSHIRVVK